MNIEGLIKQFRTDADDAVMPYRAEDEAVTGWLNEAEQEACIRARLLHESANSAVCQIAVTAGTAHYPLHPALYEIDYLAFKPTGDTRRFAVNLLSREELDRIEPGWRECTGRPEYAIQSDTALRLAFTPDAAGTLFMEGFRLPLAAMAAISDEPEINAAHHAKLVHWALHRAFSVPDSETIDPARAQLGERAFSQYFGLRPDADLRRTARQDVPHHNPAHWI